MVSANEESGAVRIIPPLSGLNISIFRINESVFSSGTPAVHMDASISAKSAYCSSNEGIYSDRSCGVAVSNIEISSGYWAMIVSTFEPTPAKYEFVIYSSPKLNIRCYPML